jgi:hypothetical protein
VLTESVLSRVLTACCRRDFAICFGLYLLEDTIGVKRSGESQGSVPVVFVEKTLVGGNLDPFIITWDFWI